jgi:hypothetical protein
MAQRAIPVSERPASLALVTALAALLFYLLVLDQGHLLSVIQGAVAFDQNFIHELVHDARHVTAVPCH